MADIADIGSEESDFHLQHAVRAARAQAALKPKLAVTGFCHNCESKVTNVLFCDIECRDDYEETQARLKRRTQ